jgi:hypothetical protein
MIRRSAIVETTQKGESRRLRLRALRWSAYLRYRVRAVPGVLQHWPVWLTEAGKGAASGFCYRFATGFFQNIGGNREKSGKEYALCG